MRIHTDPGRAFQYFLLIFLAIAPVAPASAQLPGKNSVVPDLCIWSVEAGVKLIHCGPGQASEVDIVDITARVIPETPMVRSEQSSQSQNPQVSIQTHSPGDYRLVALGETNATIAQLIKLRVADFLVLGDQHDGTRISLGNFSEVKNAMERQAALGLLGIRSKLVNPAIRKQKPISGNNLKAMSLALELRQGSDAPPQERKQLTSVAEHDPVQESQHEKIQQAESTVAPIDGVAEPTAVVRNNLRAMLIALDLNHVPPKLASIHKEAEILAINSSVKYASKKETDSGRPLAPKSNLRAMSVALDLGEYIGTGPWEPKPEVMKPPIMQTSEKVNLPTGYLVAAIGEAKSIIARLILLDETDFIVLEREPLESRVALGVYQRISNARRRQASLATLGVPTELIDRSKSNAHSSQSESRQKILNNPKIAANWNR